MKYYKIIYAEEYVEITSKIFDNNEAVIKNNDRNDTVLIVT